MFPTLPDRTDCFCGSVSRIGIHITLYKPPSPVMCHSFHTSKMTGTHQEQLIDHLRVFLVFIELNFLLYMIFSRHRRPAQAEPSTSPASINITPTTQKEKEATEFHQDGASIFYLIEERISPPPQEVNHRLQEATGSRVETGSYFETLIHSRCQQALQVDAN